MKSILLVFLITLPNLLGITHLNKEISHLISTREELKTAIYNAKNNDVILVDNIDFTSGISGLYNLFERIDIKKSITIKGKEDGSIFKRGSFDIVGGKTYADLLNVKFENINFSLYENNKALTASDWEDDAKFQYATYFSGNVNVSYSNCSFNGYMNYQGGALYAMYGNYQENPDYLAIYGDQTACKLNISLDNCSFKNNASHNAGGAIYLEGYENNISLKLNNSIFDNNISGVYARKGLGGGAIYGSDISINLIDTKLINNSANHVYVDEESLEDHSQGGAICLINSEFSFNNVVISNNVASFGGGLYFGNSNGQIISSTIERNIARRSSKEEIFYGKMANSEEGGALYFTGSGHSLIILNSKIINNMSDNVSSGIAHPIIYGQSNVNNIELFYSIYANKPFIEHEYEFDFDEPDDVLSYKSFDIKGSVILDEIYETRFPKDELPSLENGFNRFTSISKAIELGLLTVKDDNYDFNASSLSSFIFPEEIIKAIFKDNAQYMKETKLGELYSSSCELNIFKHKELIETRVVHFLEEINLNKQKSTRLKKFIGYKNEEGESIPEKFVFAEKDNVKTLNIYTKYENTSLYYFLVIGLPIIGVSLISIIVLVIILLLRKKKSEHKSKAVVLFNDEEIKKFVNCYDKVLTTKEKEIATLILKGHTRDEIAAKFYISKATVKTHINHIYTKLIVEGRDEFFALVKKTIK